MFANVDQQMACKCGGHYCKDHRGENKHGCQFNYRAEQSERIRKMNPVVTADKVPKI